MYEQEILDLFKVMVAEKSGSYHYSDGCVTDFVPNKEQAEVLRKAYGGLDITTLFTTEERRSGDIHDLIFKQILHYIEVYGLNSPGLFNLEVTEGRVITLTYVKAVTLTELGDKIERLLYINAPIKDTGALKNIIYHYHIDYDINLVTNNEMKVMLFDKNSDTFDNGDDAVRYLVYQTTGDSMLIKSKTVIDAVKLKAEVVSESYLERHAKQLAEVFHRHKPILLALRSHREHRSIINHIRRLSVKHHVPILPALNKNFVTNALMGSSTDRISEIGIRDKFKYLNLLEYKRLGFDTDAFIIRNGKTHIEGNRPIHHEARIHRIMMTVLRSLADDLAHLNKKTIILDRHVDYGLPISRKQTLGNLPFGTIITPDGDQISSGIYWENAWGARDLDLSSVNLGGFRVGWGAMSGYNNTDVIFSGDITHAEKGAMEFLTSNMDYDTPYGLFVNIFSGNVPSSLELIVGNESKKQWITNTCVREKHELKSKGNLLGFVKSGKFTVYAVRMNSNHISTPKDKAIVSKGVADFWTVQRLLDTLGIKYQFDGEGEDLRYQSFTYDKLEKLLLA